MFSKDVADSGTICFFSKEPISMIKQSPIVQYRGRRGYANMKLSDRFLHGLMIQETVS